jgi:Na+/H+ antiporter
MVAVVALSALATALLVPYPVVLVVGGAVLGFVPGLPELHLNPAVVLVVFLPPVLYGSSIFSNFNDFRANLRGLTLSAVGLVLVSIGAVGAVAHALIPHLSWAGAFTLGAIISPTDPLAASTIMRRLGAPRSLVSSIEGEGLFNDATALVAYRVASAAVVSGGFSLASAGLKLLAGAAGGVAIGLAVGWLVAQIRRRIADTQLSVIISLLTGYATYVPADALGASGVIATVTTGIYMGILGPRILPTQARLEGFFVWDILDFAVNAVLFVLIGLQLRVVIDGLGSYEPITLVGDALAVIAVITAVRFAWLFSVPYLVRALDRRPAQRERRLSAPDRLVIAWSGMRGAVSLALALAIPLSTDAGHAFPQRDLIIFLTFAVIFFSLVAQGLSLAPLIRRLGIGSGDDDPEEIRARLSATKAALAELDVLESEDWTREHTITRLRGFYQYRQRRFAARAGTIDDDDYEAQTLAYQQTLKRVLGAQRDALLQMRNNAQLSNETMNEIMRELDLEESRLEI